LPFDKGAPINLIGLNFGFSHESNTQDLECGVALRFAAATPKLDGTIRPPRKPQRTGAGHHALDMKVSKDYATRYSFHTQVSTGLYLTKRVTGQVVGQIGTDKGAGVAARLHSDSHQQYGYRVGESGPAIL